MDRWSILVEEFINVICPLSGPQCAECVQLQIFWQKIAVQQSMRWACDCTCNAFEFWMKNLRGSVGGFRFREMIAHLSDNPEVQGRYSSISYWSLNFFIMDFQKSSNRYIHYKLLSIYFYNGRFVIRDHFCVTFGLKERKMFLNFIQL